ncbi:hypothetical protein, partial [Helicobacter sp.]
MEDIEKYRDIKIQKQCYVYPAGGCAAACVNILKDCLIDVEFIMLDDREDKTSLAANREAIVSSGDYLLVCAGDVQEELLQKCQKYGIAKVIDGRVYTAFLLANAIEKEVENKEKKFEILENGRVLHIFENQWITHFYYFYDLFAYYLDDVVFAPLIQACLSYCRSVQAGDFLQMKKGIFLTFSRGLLVEYSPFEKEEIVVYFGNLESYLNNKQNIDSRYKILICPWILLDFFINRSVFFSGGSLMLLLSTHKIIKVGYGHTLCEAFQFFPKGQKLEYLMRYIKRYFYGFDYYLTLDKISKKAFKQVFEYCKIPTKLLDAGSLSLDAKSICQSDIIEAFMFIPRLNGFECRKVIEDLLNMGKKVVFRLHSACLSYSKQYGISSYAYLDGFMQHKNFSIDTQENINQEQLAKSIVITDNSSVSYSTPLSTLRPTILFAPPKKEFDLRVRNFGMSFENPILHRVALSVEECVETALQLESEL